MAPVLSEEQCEWIEQFLNNQLNECQPGDTTTRHSMSMSGSIPTRLTTATTITSPGSAVKPLGIVIRKSANHNLDCSSATEECLVTQDNRIT